MPIPTHEDLSLWKGVGQEDRELPGGATYQIPQSFVSMNAICSGTWRLPFIGSGESDEGSLIPLCGTREPVERFSG